MSERKTITLLCGLFLVTALAAPAAAAPKVIKTVPDWNQPDLDLLPAGMVVGDYPNWCAPTAAADLMGYWEDQKGCVGLTDRLVGTAASANYPNPINPNTYQQGLWHDGTVELGWYMDTGGWKTGNGPFPPRGMGFTISPNISPGAQAYARAAWIDPGGLQKLAFPNAVATPDFNAATMFATYKAEIDAGRPALVTWSRWVNVGGGMHTELVDGATVELYNGMGNPPAEGGHTTCGVGYRDDPLVAGDELIIVQDNWKLTGQYVGLNPASGFWTQNDYVTIPEPATLSLLALGGLTLIRRRRK